MPVVFDVFDFNRVLYFERCVIQSLNLFKKLNLFNARTTKNSFPNNLNTTHNGLYFQIIFILNYHQLTEILFPNLANDLQLIDVPMFM